MNTGDNKTKIGLVLEGGGMRGLYTAGVLDVFLMEGIMPDGIVGVSAGAIHACSYMSEQLGRSVRYNLKYINDKRYMSIRSLLSTGNLFNAEFCYHTIPDRLNKFDYETFRKNAEKIPFYTVATDLETGEPFYHRCLDYGNEQDYVRASASLPLVSETICLEGRKLLDGGTSDSIPLAFMRKEGFNKNIVILTRPKGYVKKPDSVISILEKVYKDYPSYIEASKNRHEMYNMQLNYVEYFEEHGDALVIRPSRDIKISRTEKNIEKLKHVYKLGRYDAMKKLEELKAFCK